ncbi:hypothetical protein [Microbacterium sp. bgisy207]|uniref:hypothetical protein n=1 Tax=Microbacterium sp. bgisy207 TaxID=3413800 RepID=UPI003EBAEEA7
MNHGIKETSKIATALALVALLTTLGACSQSREADDGVAERCGVLVEIDEALELASWAGSLAGMAVHAERLSELAREAGDVGLDEVGKQLQQVSEALSRGNFEALDVSGQRLVVAIAEVEKECWPGE